MKKTLSKIRLLGLSLLKHPRAFFLFLKYMRNEEVFDIDTHLAMASDWLLKTQSVGHDDGYSRGFYLYKGWDKSYIETTGYIISTLLDVYVHTGERKYLDSALHAGRWLLSVQKSNGAFTDIDNDIELVFDTGQVLYGLVALYESNELEAAEKERYRQAIEAAGEWLCSVQDTDGSWTTYGYQKIAHSYYSRVASILYKAGMVVQKEHFKVCASKHIDWVLSSQMENGFFDHLKFVPTQESFLHTMVYVLEGLYDYYQYTWDEQVLNALLKNANRLNAINHERDLLLCSQYDSDFHCVNPERCMTGLAQWAALAFRLFALTEDEVYLKNARKTLYYLRSKQFKEGKDLNGALPGSVPFWGEYAPYSAVNWGVKFYVDALLESQSYPLSLIDESTLWIGECFRFSSHVVNHDFSATSQEYLKFLEPYIAQAKKVLDLGCGEGKYIRYFKEKFEEKKIYGVDPYFFDNETVKQGDAYTIPFDQTFDLIYTIEVLQHVKYLDDVLKEIGEHLAKEGRLIVCDRDPRSPIGYAKPIYEFRGKWMYPFDSPFVEKWYTLKTWKKILEKNGFEIERTYTFTSPSNWKNRYSIIVTRKKR